MHISADKEMRCSCLLYLLLDFRCDLSQAKVEIIVMEGDKGAAVVSFVSKIGASTLIVGLHDQSFLYK